tara:strand:+ start:189 stop:578 length:390 start_codon:yes stop_codon:yes gene_type:complete
MKKILLLLLFIPLVFTCSDDKDSTLMITNNINEDFTLTQLSFYGYEFSNLNLQYGESQMYNLDEGLSYVDESTTTITVNITYMCDSESWTAINAIDFDEGSQTTITLTYDMDCGGITNTSGYCSGICIQ